MLYWDIINIQVNNLIAFSIFTELCNYLHNPISYYFHHLQRKTCLHSNHSHSLHTILQPWTTAEIFSVSEDLTILNILYEWDHKIYAFCVCLLSLSSLMFLKFIYVIVGISILFLLISEYAFIWTYHVLFIHSLFDGDLCYFYFLVIMNSISMTSHVKVLAWPYIFIFLSRQE
jgi:hypothetical protein